MAKREPITDAEVEEKLKSMMRPLPTGYDRELEAKGEVTMVVTVKKSCLGIEIVDVRGVPQHGKKEGGDEG